MMNQIVAAVAGGFLGWVAIEAVRYYVLRSRLITYLVVQTNTRLRAAHSNREWLNDLYKDHSSVGVTPQVAPRYSADHAEDLHESRDLVLRYLSRSKIERVTKFLAYLWESEYLTEGVCEAIAAYSTGAKALTADDCDYLKVKVARVTSIIGQWPQSIKSLDELPMDYAGVLGPGTVRLPPKR